MKNSSSKRYSNDFKERIVKLYVNGHQSMTALSREYSVTTSTVSKWAKPDKPDKPIQLTDGTETNPAQINAVIKENTHLKEENEI